MAYEIFEYNVDEYNFREVIVKFVKCSELESLHEIKSYDLFDLSNDQTSVFHRNFYDSCEVDDSFDTLYKQFVSNVVTKYLGDKSVIYQKRPTFRVCLEGNIAVAEFHKDSNYNHPEEEINFFIPVTDCSNNNTIWIEKEIDSEDYEPVTLKYGQVLVFKGGLYKHGNKVNDTGQTRVSFDFRVIKESEYEESKFLNYSSINSNKRFIVGEYYDKV
jgi:ectoine hydroxylase-related dioxygenase (phytanoyl-CoA dioxygenase family)